jgi:hypothetical protein
VTVGFSDLIALMRSFKTLSLRADDHLRMGMIVARLAEPGLCNERATSWRGQGKGAILHRGGHEPGVPP